MVDALTSAIFFKLLGMQLLVASGLVIAGLGFGGVSGAKSSALGCLIAIVPNAYFTLQAFRYNAAGSPVKALGAIYRGEAGKFVLVAVLSALTFKFLEVHSTLLLFVSLIVTTITHPIASALVIPTYQESKIRKETEKDQS